MQVESCIEKIEKRNHRNTQRMLYVNINNSSDLKSIKEHFEYGCSFVNIAPDKDKDELPMLDEIISMIETTKEVVFIEGISAYLRFCGKRQLKIVLTQLINAQYSSQAIVLLYQCDDVLHEIIQKDPRLDNCVLFVDGNKQVLPKIVFVKEKVADVFNHNIINGLSLLIQKIEFEESDNIYVKSRFARDDFKNSLYVIEEMNSFFEIVKKEYLSSLCADDEGLLSEKQWRKFADGCKKNNGVEGYFHKVIGDINSIDLYVNNWDKLSDERKNLIFIVLKTNINKSKNISLKIAIGNCKQISELQIQVYKSILTYNYKAKDFWQKYDERKVLLSAIGVSEHCSNEYCNIVETLGVKGLYFLTDLTKAERKLTIKLISLYSNEIDKIELLNILKFTYKDLWAYLKHYDYKIKELDKYFNEYKWLKVKNQISPDFAQIVEKEAKERNFYRILPRRSEFLTKLKKEGSILYFLDALGVEYLSFIAQKASELHLMMNVIICRSEVPSITTLNKEFIEVFKQSNADVIDNIKDLDKIKHSGSLEYNFSKSPFPTYLADELTVIADILEKIDANISSAYERAFIISDHGASRLAVLHKSENNWEMVNKGEHCGRCCKKSDNVVDNPNEFMTEDNDYWILANYDLFKGGRQGTVEVHGGATFEEVCVPIIEFTRMPDYISIEVLTKVIKIGYKIKPILEFVSNYKLHNAKVILGEREYSAESQDDLHFRVELQEQRAEKEYVFEVVADNNIRIDGLKFRLKSSGMVDNDIL